MERFLTTLTISGILAGFCYAQDSSPSTAIKLSGAENASPSLSSADKASYYATLNRRTIEFKAQADLLSQLAQDHRKRAEETPRDQDERVQWETGLAKELDDKSLALLVLLSNLRKERLAFEQAHPDLVASVLPNSLAGASDTRKPDEIAFLGKLEERLAALHQEIADATEAGRVYTLQLLTNSSASDFSRISSLLQDNDNRVKQLQREVSDAELRRLEFRALRRD